jgi:Spy/CpxP family protein refolding chaperone
VNVWKVIFATVVIFGAGVVTGGLVVRHSERLSLSENSRPGGFRAAQPFSAGGMRLDFLRRLQRDLDLTPGQRERVDEILSASQERSRKLMEPVLPQARQEVQRAKEEFRAVLTPAQQERFDQLLKHRELHRPGKDKGLEAGAERKAEGRGPKSERAPK